MAQAKTKAVRLKATMKEIEVARALYENDDLEVDDNAAVSVCEEDRGRWVAAWVWVSNEDMKGR